MSLMVVDKEGRGFLVLEDFLPRLAGIMRANEDFRDPMEVLAERGDTLFRKGRVVSEIDYVRVELDEAEPSPEQRVALGRFWSSFTTQVLGGLQ